MNKLAVMISPTSISYSTAEGKAITVSSSHANFKEISSEVRFLIEASNQGDTASMDEIYENLLALVEPAKKIVAADGSVEVRDGVVYYAGQPVHNTLTERILWGLRDGWPMDPYIKFMTNLMQNPSKRAVDELYKFMEANSMGISEDGYLVGYKRVRNDYRDIHSGKFDNSPGQILEMPRNEVDDERDRTCSYGFHFCAFSYLPHFGNSSGSRVVIVKVNPRDVVSIPSDYENAKARCCRYEVSGEYTGADLKDILSARPVWGGEDNWASFDEKSWDEYREEEDDYEEDFIREYNDIVEITRHIYSDDSIRVFLEWDDGSKTSYPQTPENDARVEEVLADQSERGLRARLVVTKD